MCLELLLTFLVGSVCLYATALAATRLGSRVGGFIGGLPSTALLSLLFIGITQSPEMVYSATTEFPLALAISGLFLVVFAFAAKTGFVPALAASLCCWCLLATVLAFLNFHNFFINLAIYAVVMVVGYLLLERVLLVRSVPSKVASSSRRGLAARAVVGGMAILLTVLVARAGGPLWGGIAAAFPAMSVMTLTISYRTNGLEFSRAMTKPLLVTAMITVGAFAVALRFLCLSAGLYMGILTATGLSAVCAYLTFRLILPRLD